ncbi:MAG: methyltransferase domain-containing protein [Theionarchaea archaeon]|nr:methyltransferase domain-containing protein [Theionarchaea archaeon]
MHHTRKALTFMREAGITISGLWVDCGCGHGYYAQALDLLGACPVIAIDYHIRSTVKVNMSIHVCRGDCHYLPIKDECASGFLYVNVLHYYKKPFLLIKEAYRVLEIGGHIIVIEYDQRTPTSWDPYPLSPTDIEALLKDINFNPVKTTVVDRGYRPKHLIVGKKLY